MVIQRLRTWEGNKKKYKKEKDRGTSLLFCSSEMEQTWHTSSDR
jgi:hypothetical protein